MVVCSSMPLPWEFLSCSNAHDDKRVVFTAPCRCNCAETTVGNGQDSRSCTGCWDLRMHSQRLCCWSVYLRLLVFTAAASLTDAGRLYHIVGGPKYVYRWSYQQVRCHQTFLVHHRKPSLLERVDASHVWWHMNFATSYFTLGNFAQFAQYPLFIAPPLAFFLPFSYN